MTEKQPQTNKKKGKVPGSSIFMYVASIVIALVGIAYLINSIYYFTTTIANYVAQGYPYAMVAGELIPGQLLPGLFQPMGIIGIAVVIFGAALINQKLSRHLNSAAHCEATEALISAPATPAAIVDDTVVTCKDEEVSPEIASEEITVEDSVTCACTGTEKAEAEIDAEAEAEIKEENK